MIYTTMEIKVDYQAMGVEEPPRPTKLTSYILDPKYLASVEWKVRPAVVICPGGGYEFTSPREAEPIAMKYCAAGFHCFILDYAIKPAGWPAACCELSKAVAYVRSIADQHGIDKDKIVVCGFSAGGHLAASLGVYYQDETVRKYSGVIGDENKPNGMILGYPVITDHDTHQGTHDNFVAGREEVKPLFGLENHVSKATPKTFIWHTFEDNAVPVVSTTRFVNALVENGIPCEVHIYPEGCHGLSLANQCTAGGPNGIVPAVQNWVDMSVTWMNNL